MLHLTYSLWAAITAAPPVKLLLVGPAGCGKSVFAAQVHRLFASDAPSTTSASCPSSSASSYQPTVGLNVVRATVEGTSLLLWDMGGDPALRPLWETYFQQCDGIVVMVDGAALLSDDAASATSDDARAILFGVLRRPELEHVPVCLVATRSDAVPRMTAADVYMRMGIERFVADQMSSLAARRGMREADPLRLAEGTAAGSGAMGLPSGRLFRCVVASGLTGAGVREAMQWFVSLVAVNAKSAIGGTAGGGGV